MTSMEAEADLRASRAAFWKHRLVWFAIACTVLLVAVVIRLFQGDRAASAAPAPTATAAKSSGGDNEPLPRIGRPQHDIMALVNGKDITRPMLTDACVKRYG